jgi:outer membrane protein OmpA-like peptidoglycan-associated protein
MLRGNNDSPRGAESKAHHPLPTSGERIRWKAGASAGINPANKLRAREAIALAFPTASLVFGGSGLGSRRAGGHIREAMASRGCRSLLLQSVTWMLMVPIAAGMVILTGCAGTKEQTGSDRPVRVPSRPSGSSSNSAASAPPNWKPFPLGTPVTQVPLRRGLTIVGSSYEEPYGDYEAIYRVESVTPKGVAFKVSAEVPNPLVRLFASLTKSGSPRPKDAMVLVEGHRTVRSEDLVHAHAVMNYFSSILPDVFPATTAMGYSADVVTELKTNGRTAYFGLSDRPDAAPKMAGAAVNPTNSTAAVVHTPSAEEIWAHMPKINCAVTRTEPGDVAFPVIVNGQRVVLPAIHAVCHSEEGNSQDYILDDPANPLGLAHFSPASLKSGSHGQVTEVAFPEEKSAQGIQQQLSVAGRAEIRGIYFDFGSDQIRPESEPVLKEIAEAMIANPSWRLSVEGHTDNIGGDAYNQGLSERRAAAVKRALVEQYQISADRLATVGYGSTRPKESNDTLEGRARNRRVELVKQ